MPLDGVLFMVLWLLFTWWCDKLEGSASPPNGVYLSILESSSVLAIWPFFNNIK